MSTAPIYVVVCQNDKAHPQYGADPGGAIVHETYIKDASLQLQQARAAMMERWGACRVGRVVFEGETGFDVPHGARWLSGKDDPHATEATEGPGWHLTWDGTPVAVHDGPRYWMHCPADPDAGEHEHA